MPDKLPYKTFLKTFELVPRVACNLIITDSQRRLLLTKRANPPGVGTWHFPGSFILKGEKITNCLERIAEEELGITIVSANTKLLGVFDSIGIDPRGHAVDILYGYRLIEAVEFKPIGDTKEAQFFAKLPKGIGFNHEETLRQLGFT